MKRGFMGVPLGRVSVVALCLFLFAVPAVAGDEPLSKQLVVAQAGNWSTTGKVANYTESVLTVDLDGNECNVSPCATAQTIAPGGAALIDSLPAGFYAVPAPASTSSTLLRFDDGLTRQSYALPAVGALIDGVTQTFGPVSNDGVRTLTVNVLPTNLTEIELEVIDKNGQRLSIERIDARPPVTQYPVRTQFDVGSIRLTLDPSFGRFSRDPVYGFVAEADDTGGNALAIPFG